MSASFRAWLVPTGTGLGEPAAATRDGTALAPGDASGVRTGVGIGVLRLRVSVAAAPGSGVGSALRSVEHPEPVAETTSAETSDHQCSLRIATVHFTRIGLPRRRSEPALNCPRLANTREVG